LAREKKEKGRVGRVSFKKKGKTRTMCPAKKKHEKGTFERKPQVS